MKINHMICPNCGHDSYTNCDYETCSACNTFFYAAQSRTCRYPAVTPIQIQNLFSKEQP